MDPNPSSGAPQDRFMAEYSLDRRIRSYKECCFRAYAYGLASLSIVTSASYSGMSYAFRNFPIRSKYIILVSGLFGCVAAYKVTHERTKDCNLILKAHRESLHIPVEPTSS